MKDIISYYIFEKVDFKNCLFYYKLTKLYRMKNINNYFCNFFLQQYLLKKDVNQFYNLDLQVMCQVLSCPELEISSELELFNAAVDWIDYKPKERYKHMNTLLKLVRLPLLSDAILTEVLKKHKLCIDCVDCKFIIEEAIMSKNNSVNKTSNKQFENRHYTCPFEAGQILMIGGADDRLGDSLSLKRDFRQTASYCTLDEFNFKKYKTTSKMQKQRNNCKSAVIGNKVYCFGGDHTSQENLTNSCEVYCRKTDTWSLIAPYPIKDITYSCVCSFMNKIYVFGNFYGSNWVYDPAQNDWKLIPRCKTMRFGASCTVFQGECVVVGGWLMDDDIDEVLKTVESYDHHSDSWSFLAGRLQVARSKSAVVAKGNKLFVIGGYGSDKGPCEVYDSLSKKFSYFSNFHSYRIELFYKFKPFVTILGSNIVVYVEDTIYTYDLNKDKWSLVHLNNLTKGFDNSCVKLHRILQ